MMFVFPGQGGQWTGMGQALFREDVFRSAIEECGAAMRPYLDWDVVACLREGLAATGVDRIQPALFAVSVALSALWRSWGMEPDCVAGHSMGEVAAAFVAGALDLPDAARVICCRSSLLRRLSGRGAMATVELSAADAAGAVRDYRGRLSVAASNSGRSTVLSGEVSAIDSLLADMEHRGVFCRRVKVDVASHCAQVDELRAELCAVLNGIRPHRARIPMYSTVTGALIRGVELEPQYWADNLRQTVRFADVIRGAIGSGCRRFLEMGPHPVLAGAIEEVMSEEGIAGIAVGCERRGEGGRSVVLESLASLYEDGHPVQWSRINTPGRVVPLPAYAWQRERFWIESPAPARRTRGGRLIGELRSIPGPRPLHSWQTTWTAAELHNLSGHRLQGRDVLPGSAFVEMALAAGAELFGPDWNTLERFEWSHFLEFPESRDVQLVMDDDGEFTIFSRDPGDGWSGWQRHASGHLRRTARQETRIDLDSIRGRLTRRLTGDQFYSMLSRRGLDLSGPYRGLAELWQGSEEALARIEIPAPVRSESARYRIHPVLLDAYLQTTSVAWGEDTRMTPVPVAAARIAVLPGVLGEWVWVYRGDLRVTDASGNTVVEINGLRLDLLPQSHADWLHELRWELTAPVTGGDARGRWLLSGSGGVHDELAAALESRGGRCVADLGAPGDALRGVVLLADRDEPSWERALNLVKDLARAAFRQPPRLWIVTCGTQAAGDGRLSLGGAELWGFGRTVMYEHPEWRCTLVDLADGETRGQAENPPISEVELLVAELLCDSPEDQVALRPGGRMVARLVPRGSRDRKETEPLPPAADRPFRLRSQRPGTWDHVRCELMDRRRPECGEVEVEVRAAGLNFLDVLKALGSYPGQSVGPADLGVEFAGVVTATGAGVTRFAAGDAVVGCAPGALATHVVTLATGLARKPDTIGWESAAALPAAYVTAYHSLVELARLTKGERVLIHSGASGTGLAAVEIALWLGAEVWATAGTEQKRQFLRERGVVRVMDSRTLLFADEIARATSGAGVAVVINSLAGEGLLKSLEAVAAYGRFVDLSKRDLWDRDRLDSKALRRNLSYHVVDMAALVRDHPERFAAVLKIVLRHLAGGDWRLPPIEPVPADAAREALRRMSAGQHIGKMVVSTGPPHPSSGGAPV